MLLILAVGCFSISCQKATSENKPDLVEKDTTSHAKPSEFEMYQFSEMALLMEQMYVDNQRLREKIMNGDSLGMFPEHFEKIHSSVMTDDSDMDDFFKEHAQEFIEAQKLIYDHPKDAKKYFNQAVQACVTCHEVKCGGPIPKIKKLYIP
jgi:cytochrome c553